MSKQYVMSAPQEQSLPYEAADMAQGLGIQLASFLFPLLVALDELLDKRLVRTFLGSIESILAFRDRIHGLLLSELGAFLLSPEQDGAGTKRLASLIHSCKWSSQLIDAFLWSWATTLLEGMVAMGQEVYASLRRERVGEARKHQAGGSGAGARKLCASINACQTGLLPASSSPDFCPGPQLVRRDPGGRATKGGRALPGGDALVEYPWTAG